MAESKPIDSISKLHKYTIEFARQVGEIMEQCLIQCSKVDNYDDLSANPQVQKIDTMVDTLITDFKSFDSIIDSLKEFHTTEAKQCEEIKELSQKNQELTKQLVDRIEEFDSIQHELGLIVDNVLNKLDG